MEESGSCFCWNADAMLALSCLNLVPGSFSYPFNYPWFLCVSKPDSPNSFLLYFEMAFLQFSLTQIRWQKWEINTNDLCWSFINYENEGYFMERMLFFIKYIGEPNFSFFFSSSIFPWILSYHNALCFLFLFFFQFSLLGCFWNL